jgi:hypothetical protein
MAKLKSCPTCNRTYSDEAITFCLVDGSILSASYDPQATLQISSVRETTPPPTQILQPNISSEYKPTDLYSKQKVTAKPHLIRTAIIGALIGVLIGAVTGLYLEINYYSGRHVTQAAVACGVFGLLVGTISLPVLQVIFSYVREKLGAK